MYFRPPDADCTRSYAVPTLLRWRRAYLKDGLRGLLPKSRKLGEALALTDVQPFGVDEIPDFAKHRFLGPDGKAVLMLLTPREPPWDTKILIEW
ncbi:MAG: hypothetical protein IID54_03775, partial [Proteobacteria bacterium]|nr:hypothetical protein [Pseudomonadota bacterium]